MLIYPSKNCNEKRLKSKALGSSLSAAIRWLTGCDPGEVTKVKLPHSQNEELNVE